MTVIRVRPVMVYRFFHLALSLWFLCLFFVSLFFRTFSVFCLTSQPLTCLNIKHRCSIHHMYIMHASGSETRRGGACINRLFSWPEGKKHLSWSLPPSPPCVSPCFLSAHRREAVGHRPPVFPDHHDEDGPHQAHRAYGVSEKVSVSIVRRGLWSQNKVDELSKLIPWSLRLFVRFVSHTRFFFPCRIAVKARLVFSALREVI